MTKIYKSQKDNIYKSIYLLLCTLLTSLPFFAFFDKKTSLLECLFMAFIFWGLNLTILISFLRMKIKITEHQIVVNIIFDFFTLNINDITKIRIGETLWSGFHKYGTATGGLIIFSKYKNDLYITPENQDQFLKELLEINRHIIIDDVRK